MELFCNTLLTSIFPLLRLYDLFINTFREFDDLVSTPKKKKNIYIYIYIVLPWSLKNLFHRKVYAMWMDPNPNEHWMRKLEKEQENVRVERSLLHLILSRQFFFFFFLGKCGGLNPRVIGYWHNRVPTRLDDIFI